MKAINNIDTLIERLSLIDKDWQRIIYDKTGVILSERLTSCEQLWQCIFE